jgi:NADH-quinone oxidoreductase subunit I
MTTIFKHLFKPAYTVQYPDVRRELPERSRMSFALLTDEDGVPLCKSCLLCEKSCQDHAIVIESEKREDAPGRRLTRFTIDLGRCMYCGICVEQCANKALVSTGEFENCTTERSGTLRVLYEEPLSDAETAATPPDDEEEAES